MKVVTPKRAHPLALHLHRRLAKVVTPKRVLQLALQQHLVTHEVPMSSSDIGVLGETGETTPRTPTTGRASTSARLFASSGTTPGREPFGSRSGSCMSDGGMPPST